MPKIQPRSDNCRGFRRIQKTVNPKEPSIAHWSLNLNGEEAILCHGAGHLCGLAPAEDYDERYKFWNFDNYPIIPEHFITRVKIIIIPGLLVIMLSSSLIRRI